MSVHKSEGNIDQNPLDTRVDSMDTHKDKIREPVRNNKEERTGSLCVRNSLVIGLTGGIATGKSTVAQMLRDLGAQVVSADEVVHRLLRRHTRTWRTVVREFGEDILASDENIDRKRLGSVVFQDPERRARLENIVHPPVLRYLSGLAKCFRRKGNGVLVLEIPLLIETSSQGIVDKVLLVTAEQDTQINRLKYRYGIGTAEAVLRIKSQLPMQEKLQFADWVIDTDMSLEDTRSEVNRVWLDVQKSLAARK